jgi:hypothetical protein
VLTGETLVNQSVVFSKHITLSSGANLAIRVFGGRTGISRTEVVNIYRNGQENNAL